jgi:hypothetical protein
MPETNLRCPECDARIKVNVSAGRSSVRCPDCGATVRLKGKADDDDDRPARSSRRRREEDEDEDDRPARPSKRRREDDDEDEEDRPRRRRLYDGDDDEDEDDRPRRRKKRKREEEGDGPWLIAAGVAAAGFVLMFMGPLLLMGTRGLPPGQDGPGGKLFGLGLCFLFALILMALGIVGVKNRTAYGRWGMEITGTMGVILGMIQATIGGLMGGFGLYGLLFTLINGH